MKLYELIKALAANVDMLITDDIGNDCCVACNGWIDEDKTVICWEHCEACYKGYDASAINNAEVINITLDDAILMIQIAYDLTPETEEEELKDEYEPDSYASLWLDPNNWGV